MTKLPVVLRPFQPLISGFVRSATSVASPLVRLFSRVFGDRALPRRVYASTHDYVLSRPYGATLETVRNPETIIRPVPRGIPENHERFVVEQFVSLPGAFVGVLPRGRVVSDVGSVVTADDTMLFDLSPYFSVHAGDTHPIFRRLRLPPRERVEGVVANLAARGHANYFHFLLDVLPRLELIDAARSIPRIDRYLVDESRSFQRELLDVLGVPIEHRLNASMHGHLEAERLIVPSFQTFNEQTPRWVVQFLRSRFLLGPSSDRSTDRQRIYVSRGSGAWTRRVINEEAVVDSLAAWDVTPVHLEEMTVGEQIDLFASAELIVAPHGAGITNVVFCSPGTKIIELLHPSYVNTCYWKLCSQVEGVEYFYVLAKGKPPPFAHDVRAVSADLDVEIAALEAALRAVGL